MNRRSSPEWVRVHQLVDEQKYESAARELEQLCAALASDPGRETEWAEAVIWRVQLQTALHGYARAVELLREQPPAGSFLPRCMLELARAQVLHAYLRAYSWEIRQRTPISAPGPLPIEQMSADQIVAEALQAHARLFRVRSELDQAPASVLGEILEAGDYPAGIRDSLRDLLAYLSVELLADKSCWRPEESTELYRLGIEELLGPEPAGERFSLDDAAIHPLRRLCGVLEDLERWHAGRGERDAALEARLERVRRLESGFGPDDRRELERLEAEASSLARREGDRPWSAWASALQASLLRRRGDLRGAHAVASAAAGRFSGSRGAERCAAIARELEAPEYQLESMLVDGIGRRTLLVTHKNLRRLHLRAIAFDLDQHLRERRDYNLLPWHQEWREALERTPPESCVCWSVELAETPDLRLHRTHLSPPIDRPGLYAIIASADPGFREVEGNRVVGCNLILSDLVLLVQDRADRTREVMVVSGACGEPVAGATVELWQAEYQRGHRLLKSARSDKSGSVSFGRLAEQRYYFVVARAAGQLTIEAQPRYLGSGREQREEDALIYTDRSIYRPGQKLHLKIVAYRGLAARSKRTLLTRTKVELELLDPNREVVARATVKTSEHGSASHLFEIPAGRPLGLWRIRTSLGSESSIRVEEYKRPSFELRFRPRTQASRLNEPVELEGEARYFFGLPVSEGRVCFRVERTPAPPPFWWWRPPPERAQRIASGAGELRPDGSFSVRFTAEVDPRKAARPETAFRYTVHAELTDEGGETARASETLRLGFCDVEAAFDGAGGFLLAGEAGELEVRRSDRDGAARAGRGRYRLNTVVQPQVTGGPADLPVPPEEVPLPGWVTLPGDPLPARWQASCYRPEREMATWPDGEELAAGELEHGADGRARIPLSPLPAGVYRVRYQTEDEGGHRFEATRELLCVGSSTPIGLPALLRVEAGSVEVGGTARIFAASGTYDQVLVLEVHQAGERLSRTLLRPGDRELLELPVKREHRGGFAVVLHAIRDFQAVHLEQRVLVPWSDKTLQLEWSSFRDRLQPGQQESWRLTLRSHDGGRLDAAVAEVLAYMFDRSLEAFVPHTPRPAISIFPDGATARPTTTNLTGVLGYAFLPDHLAPRISDSPLRPDRLRRLDSYGIGGLGQRFGAVPGGPPMPCCAPQAGSAPGRSQALSEPKAEAEPAEEGGGASGEPVAIRSSFAETAFFLPHLLCEPDGSVSFSFQVPDSVTAYWVWVHAITRDLRSLSERREVRVVKELMVRPYAPRFLREGDRAELRVLVQNAGASPLSGELQIDLLDEGTGQSVLARFGVAEPRRGFTVEPGGSQALGFTLEVPSGVGVTSLRVEARAGGQSDGELRPLPILPGRMHLAQSRLVTLRDRERRVIAFPEMRGDDPTLEHEQLVVTLDARLLQKVLEALPYLVEFPYECCEQVLNRYVSCSILSSVYASSPELARLGESLAERDTPLERWDAPDPNRRMAIEETPWLRAARGGESELPLIRLLDPRVAARHRERSLRALAKAQTASGGFPWFPGGPPSPFITLYLLEGFARAAELGVEPPRELVRRAFGYLAGHFRSDILPRMRREEISPEVISYLLHVLAAVRDESLLAESFSEAEREELLAFSLARWKQQAPMLRSQLALALHRRGRVDEARLVFGSVLDCARSEPDRGTFWAPEERSWLWYNDTIEGHAQALVTTQEVFPDHPAREGMVLWLLLNKKLNQWKSTRATAAVIYALTRQARADGSLGARQEAVVRLGGEERSFAFEPDRAETTQHWRLDGARIDAATASEVSVEQRTPGLMLASATWHFSTERLPAEAQGDFFRLERRCYRCEKQGAETRLVPLGPEAVVSVGDELEVQLSLRSGHAAEYVHLRDPRGAGFEPEQSLSGYTWDPVPCYREIRDSGANFFIDWVPAGELLLRHRLRATMAGRFRIHPATVQPIYAPEFAAYSSGTTIRVEAGRP